MENLLTRLYAINAPSGGEKKMRKFVKNELIKIGCEVHTDKKGNLYAIKGKADFYACAVSHLDEVHYHTRPIEIIQHNGRIFGLDTKTMDLAGIGADDKNGIFACLTLASRVENIKLAFFVEEETGCNGSRYADMAFFTNVNFVLQADRRGGSDFITNAAGTELCTDEFFTKTEANLYGFKKEYGSITDVMQLKDNGLNVCCANLSAGYYNAHCSNEYTVLSELYNTIELMYHICIMITEPQNHEPTYIDKYDYNGYSDYSNYDHDNYYMEQIVEWCIEDNGGRFDIDVSHLMEEVLYYYPHATEAEVQAAFYAITGCNLAVY